MLFDTIYALLMLFLFPVWDSGTVVYLNLALGLATLLSWFWAQFLDPGYVQKPKGVDFLVSSILDQLFYHFVFNFRR